MITAVDTNIFVDILGSDREAANSASDALLLCRERGDVVLCLACYAELAVRFANQPQLDEFLDGYGFQVSDLSPQAAFTAGKLYAAFVKRGGRKGRILPDFLIGAHALHSADQLLTRDARFFSNSFKNLVAITPAKCLE